MQLIHDYNACTGIVANPTKSRIMIAGARGDGHPFNSGTGDVPILGPNDPQRHLGVYLTARGRGTAEWAYVTSTFND
ncbi:hypothetical protein RI367_008786, partial [Sorochytrium milnesiophthora]